MKILITYYSRTQTNAEIALLLAEDLIAKGHSVDFEKIEPVKEENRWVLLKRTWMNWPPLIIGLFSNKYRRYFYDNFKHHEMDIKPLAYPDVSDYDRIIIGSPKWVFMSYPIARYIRQVEGHQLDAFQFILMPALAIGSPQAEPLGVIPAGLIGEAAFFI